MIKQDNNQDDEKTKDILISRKYKYKDMQYNSKQIKHGDIFVALQGTNFDGHDYIHNAILNGAKAIICTKKVHHQGQYQVDYYYFSNLRNKLGWLSSQFYQYPQNELKIIGVTGTNGKTTITYFLQQILGQNKCARVGTIQYKIGDQIIQAKNTTPQSLDIIKMCKKSVQKKLQYFILQVSSHGLRLDRVSMLKFDVAIFSNLSPEHLDFHKDMQDYYDAKKQLFLKLKQQGVAIINIDDNYGQRYYQQFGGLSYGIKLGNLKGQFVNHKIDQIKITYKDIQGQFYQYENKVNILGRYNLYNLLAAIGAALSLKIVWKQILPMINKINSAPGRFEFVNCSQNYVAIVDFAHTADALQNLLKTVRQLDVRKIITVFGCGGDRDKNKRPIMTKIALKYSDIVIVTSDNPRKQKIQNIIEEMTKDIVDQHLFIQLDRRKAIQKAVEYANEKDVVVVAGKGHQNYQIIGNQNFYFSDRYQLQNIINKKQKITI